MADRAGAAIAFGYSLFGLLLRPAVPFILSRRVALGKEDRQRTTERYGDSAQNSQRYGDSAQNSRRTPWAAALSATTVSSANTTVIVLMLLEPSWS